MARSRERSSGSAPNLAPRPLRSANGGHAGQGEHPGRPAEMNGIPRPAHTRDPKGRKNMKVKTNVKAGGILLGS